MDKFHVGQTVNCAMTDGRLEQGEIVYVRLDHLNDFKTVAAVSVRLYSKMSRSGYEGTIFHPSKVTPCGRSTS